MLFFVSLQLGNNLYFLFKLKYSGRCLKLMLQCTLKKELVIFQVGKLFLTIYTSILLFYLINLNTAFSISFNMYDSETIICLMLGNDCWGQLVGISVGHRFYSRAEMVAVGFHSHWLNGIDYMGQSYKKGVSIHFYLYCYIILTLSYLPRMSGGL